jgi:hypothetical protein
MAGFANHRNHWGPPGFLRLAPEFKRRSAPSFGAELFIPNCGHFDLHIGAVEQRAADFGEIALDDAGRGSGTRASYRRRSRMEGAFIAQSARTLPS